MKHCYFEQPELNEEYLYGKFCLEEAEVSPGRLVGTCLPPNSSPNWYRIVTTNHLKDLCEGFLIGYHVLEILLGESNILAIKESYEPFEYFSKFRLACPFQKQILIEGFTIKSGNHDMLKKQANPFMYRILYLPHDVKPVRSIYSEFESSRELLP